MLLPFVFVKKRKEEIKNLNRKDLTLLISLGVVFYALTQGAQFVGLSLLPAVTVSMMLNFTPLIVALMGVVFLSERPSAVQWFGSALFIAGILIYFFPTQLSENKFLGIVVMIIGVLANSGSAVLGRAVNRDKKFSALTITVISMGVGSMILLSTGLIVQGLPPISIETVYFLLWLAIVNTALAFTLWNKTLQSLTAMESSIINGTMLIQIGILAWIFIDEPITLKEGLGMFIAALGAVLVQLRRKKAP